MKGIRQMCKNKVKGEFGAHCRKSASLSEADNKAVHHALPGWRPHNGEDMAHEGVNKFNEIRVHPIINHRA